MTDPRPASWPFRPWMSVDRGGWPESFHEGALVVVDDGGSVRASLGGSDFPVFIRSSLKMIQALPVVESGAADAFGLDERLLALCCASHSGEPFHVDGAREILRRAGAREEWLHCGAHPPVHRPSAADLVRAGQDPEPIHNNCSGKHAGMLAVCVRRGWDPDGYWKPDHPLQMEIAGQLAALAGVAPEDLEHGVDGCGVPAFRLPMIAFARGVARFAGRTADGDAAARIFDAMNRHPDMVGGTGRFCTELPRAANRPVIAKAGAEGFYIVAWRDEEGRGVALAAKAADPKT